jgi:hypothetical protein
MIRSVLRARLTDFRLKLQIASIRVFICCGVKVSEEGTEDPREVDTADIHLHFLM